jgi:tRNA threonylcarbamoyl adenosine modification protein YeaZ
VTAKILAYASKAQVIGVNTLHAIALQAPDEANRVTAILDAQRSQLYVADFHRVDNWLEPIAETRITDRETWIDDLTSESIIIGPVLEKLSSNMDSSVPLAPKESWEPTAVNVGRLGLHLYQQGQRDDYWKMVPNYYRLSAAEEKARAEDKKADAADESTS